MRTFIQNSLNNLKDIECGEIISDDIVEDNVTYFGYQLSKNYMNSDFEKNCTYRINLTGYVIRRIQPTENTTQIIDDSSELIIDTLKALNFKCNSEDISIKNNIRKNKITGYVEYNEINKKLII